MYVPLPGDPIWVVAGLTQEVDDGVVTVASRILAVAPTRVVAEDVFHVLARSVDASVIDLRIEESTLVNW